VSRKTTAVCAFDPYHGNTALSTYIKEWYAKLIGYWYYIGESCVVTFSNSKKEPGFRSLIRFRSLK
jgi:hypothetical protein